MNSFFVFFFFQHSVVFSEEIPLYPGEFLLFLGKNAKHRIEILFNSIHL